MIPMIDRNNHIFKKGLVGHWGYAASGGSVAAGGIARDGSGNGGHGTLSSTFMALTPSGFSCTGGYVEMAGSYVFSALSVCLWVKVTNFASPADQGILGHATGFAYALYPRAATTKIAWVLDDNGSWGPRLALAPASTQTAGVWYHVVGLWVQAGYAALYLNGVQAAISTDANFTPYAAASKLRIASWAADADKLRGTVDDVRIYSRALTAGEIKLLYYATKRN